MTNRAYTINQFLATYGGFSRASLYRAWKEGRGPSRIYIGRRVLIPADAAERWLQNLTVLAGSI